MEMHSSPSFPRSPIATEELGVLIEHPIKDEGETSQPTSSQTMAQHLSSPTNGSSFELEQREHHEELGTPPRKKNRIAFGSCNDQDLRNDLWPIIESRDPAAFIWGGDAIYAGTKLPT